MSVQLIVKPSSNGFSCLSPHLVPVSVTWVAGEEARERGQTSTHSQTLSLVVVPFIHLHHIFVPALAKQHNKNVYFFFLWIKKRKLSISNCTYEFSSAGFTRICVIAIGSGNNFPPVFLGRSDTESDVIYFCLVDDHDLQTVSHCYFIRNSCQWLLVTSRGNHKGFYRCHVLDRCARQTSTNQFLFKTYGQVLFLIGIEYPFKCWDIFPVVSPFRIIYMNNYFSLTQIYRLSEAGLETNSKWNVVNN